MTGTTRVIVTDDLKWFTKSVIVELYTCTYLGTDGALSGRDGTPGTGRDGRDGGAGFAPEEGRGGAACLEFL